MWSVNYLKALPQLSVSIDYVDMTGVYSKIQELYMKTTQDNIIHRFLHPVADPTYVYRYLWGRSCRSFFIYYDNKPVGVVDVTPCGDGAEVAILIIDAYQAEGLGRPSPTTSPGG